MIRWLRLVSRRWWLAVPAMYLIIILGPAAIGYGTMGDLEGAKTAVRELWPRYGALFVFAGALYGVARVLVLCPLTSPDYRRWLQLTPWTSAKPLPLAPMHVTWQDGVLAVIFSGFAWIHGFEYWWGGGITVLLGYGLALSGCFAYTRRLLPALLAAFSLGLPIFFFHQPVPALVASALCLGILQWGVGRFLRAFPWDSEDTVPSKNAQDFMRNILTNLNRGDALLERHVTQLRQCGWPYGATDPTPPDRAIPVSHGLLIAALVGWWLSAVVHVADPGLHFTARDITPFSAFFAGVVSLVRLGVYFNGFAWPLSIAGRFAHGKLLLRGFDTVFVAPLCAVAASQVVPRVLHAVHASPLLALFLTFFTVLASALCIGPSYRSWVLTSTVRFTPPYLSSGSQVHRKL